MQDVKTGDVFASLRQFVRVRSNGETRCELCGAGIAPEHSHLLEAKSRKVMCSCRACAILFSSHAAANYYRIPSTTRFLADFNLEDAEWDSLAIPINMAFFCLHNDSNVPAAYYPSPAGATQSLLPMDAWTNIVDRNPVLHKLEPEVECLLINRVTKPHEYYVTPIDECYRVVGLIRSKWHGFSGGSEMWKAIGVFFTSLKARANGTGSVPDVRA